MPVVPKSTIKLDLSRQIIDLFPDENEEEMTFIVADLGPIGDIRILQDVNVFLALQIGGDDTGAIGKMLASVVHPEDRKRFVDFLEKRRKMDVKALMGVFELMLEAATGGRPTNSPSDSSAGTPRKAAVQRSGARSLPRASTSTG